VFNIIFSTGIYYINPKLCLIFMGMNIILKNILNIDNILILLKSRLRDYFGNIDIVI